MLTYSHCRGLIVNQTMPYECTKVVPARHPHDKSYRCPARGCSEKLGGCSGTQAYPEGQLGCHCGDVTDQGRDPSFQGRTAPVQPRQEVRARSAPVPGLPQVPAGRPGRRARPPGPPAPVPPAGPTLPAQWAREQGRDRRGERAVSGTPSLRTRAASSAGSSAASWEEWWAGSSAAS